MVGRCGMVAASAGAASFAPVAVVEAQPLLLALAMGANLASRVFQPQQRVQMEVSSALGQRVLQQDEQAASTAATVKAMERQLTKLQSRVVLCTEQLKALRRSTDDTRSLATDTLIDHANNLTELQEQTNSLQRVLSSLQDVVVKQIEVMTPPIKKLTTRVSHLEADVRQLDRTHAAPPVKSPFTAAHSSVNPAPEHIVSVAP